MRHDTMRDGTPSLRTARAVQKLLSVLLAFSLLLTGLPVTALAESQTDSAWDGATVTEVTAADDAYSVGTGAELAWVAQQVNAGTNSFQGKTIHLTADIDLGNQAWTPIGIRNNYFQGIFDGGGHTVSGLNVSGDVLYAGLFGHINHSGAVVKNLGVSGTVSSTVQWGKAGGVAGALLYGNIKNCWSSVEVSPSGTDAYAGGIAGNHSEGTVENCYATGDVTASGAGSCAGGVVGLNSGTVKNCYATGGVSADSSSSYAGGVAGRHGNASTLQYCYATGDVSANAESGSAGGIVGIAKGALNSPAHIEYCAALGLRVTGSAANTNRVAGTETDSSNLSDNYARADMKVNGNAVTSGTGPTTKHGMDAALGTNGTSFSSLFQGFGNGTAWSFTDSTKLAEGVALPTLQGVAQTPAPALPSWPLPPAVTSPDMAFTSGETYSISNATQLGYLAANVNAGRSGAGASFELTADIDLNNASWTPIGTGEIYNGSDGKSHVYHFAGTFDGKGHTISGLNVSVSTDYAGLFGSLTGTVKNLGVTGAVSNTCSNNNALAGGIAGGVDINVDITGTIEQCWSAVNVSISNSKYGSAGGIAGRSDGTIQSCYATGAITSSGTNGFAGGIVGRNGVYGSGTMDHCYATGKITANATDGSAGGIAGRIYNDTSGSSKIEYCNALGAQVNGSAANSGRIVGQKSAGTLTGNRARGVMLVNGETRNTDEGSNGSGMHGGTIAEGADYTAVFDSSSPDFWDYSTIWNTPTGTLSDGALPTLKNATQSPAPVLPAAIVAVESVSVSPETLSLFVGGTATPAVTLTPTEATDTVTWSSSDSDKATVSENGLVTGVAAGGATITATAGGKTATCTVTVKAQPTYESFTQTSVDGTDADNKKYYNITSTADLTALAAAVNSGKKYTYSEFKLTADIDLNNEAWIPIGHQESFDGVFYGDGHTVSNMKVTGTSYYCAGLFGFVHGTVKNLGVTGSVAISYSGSMPIYAGGVAGSLSTASGTSSPTATVENCWSSADVKATNTGNSRAYAGGVAGAIAETGGEIKSCFATGKVEAVAKGSSAYDSFARAGGITGGYDYASGNATISNCAALDPSVSAAGKKENAGRVIGYTATGRTTLTGNKARADMPVNTILVATEAGTATNEHGEALAVGASEGTALSDIFSGWNSSLWSFTSETKLAVNASLPKLTNSSATAPTLPAAGAGYAPFTAEAADGTGEDAKKLYAITGKDSLAALATAVNGGASYQYSEFKLAADIDLNSEAWTPIGTAERPASGDFTSKNPFAGVFDGSGHTIKNLSVTGESQAAGLFGAVTGTVKNLGVTGTVSIQAPNGSFGVGGTKPTYAGGITGLLDGGKIEQCWSSVAVTVTSAGQYSNCFAGGIAGGSSDKASDEMKSCYSTGNVTITLALSGTKREGTYGNAGGIVGWNQGTVQYCYATGKVAGLSGDTSDSSGGVAGRHSSGSLINCAGLNAEVTGAAQGSGRVAGRFGDHVTMSGNYARADMLVNDAVPTENIGADKKNGEDAAVGSGGMGFNTLFGGWTGFTVTITSTLTEGVALPTLAKVPALPDSAPKLPAGIITGHIHCVCGTGTVSTGSHAHDATVTWTEWSTENALPTDAGYYYLENDVSLSAAWEPADGTYLCLNGHTVSYTYASASQWDDGAAIQPRGLLSVCDCQTTAGKITASVTGDGSVHAVKLTGGSDLSHPYVFNLYSGTVETTGGYAGYTVYYADSFSATCTFNLYGGTVKSEGNPAIALGLGMTANLYGGKVEVTNDSGCGIISGIYGGKLKLGGAQITQGKFSHINTSVPDMIDATGYTGADLVIQAGGQLKGYVLVTGVTSANKDKFSLNSVYPGYHLEWDSEAKTLTMAQDAPDTPPEEPTYEISGTVTDGGNPAAGAAVKLMRGKAEIAAATTDGSGAYTFTKIPAGAYNIVAVKDGKTVTLLVSVKDGNLTDQILNMPAENKNSVLEVTGEDTPAAVVGGLDEIAANTELDGATSVTIKLTVESKQEDAATGAEDIKTLAGEQTLDGFLDLTLNKVVVGTGAGTTPITDTGSNILEIVLPYDFNGKKDVAVYRYHSGTASALTQTDTGDDGTFRLDRENGFLYIYAAKFSTYAIAYTPKTTPPAGGGTQYQPTVVTEHGSIDLSPQSASAGTTVTITVTPEAGYELDKLTVTAQSGETVAVTHNGDGSYSFTQPNGTVTIHASFQPEQPLPFRDVKKSDWFYQSVRYVYKNGLMNGTERNRFSPSLDTSRAMIVTILWRLEGSPEAGKNAPFSDTASNAYYTQAVAWGAEKGIIQGYSQERFGPDDPVTRQQLAAILYRYAQYKGQDTAAAGDLSDFTDQPSDWAAAPVRWAVGAGIICGKGNGILDPRGHAARAETAVMLTRYLQNKP